MIQLVAQVIFHHWLVDCGYTLEPPCRGGSNEYPQSMFWSKNKKRGVAVLTCTHNLCFGAKIRKTGIALHTPVLLYKSGVQGGIHFMDMFS